MTEPSLDNLLNGFVTRVEESAETGVTIVVQADGRSYILRVQACDCGHECDLIQTTVERVRG